MSRISQHEFMLTQLTQDSEDLTDTHSDTSINFVCLCLSMYV